MSDTSSQRVFGWPQAMIAAVLSWFRNLFSPVSLVRESIEGNLQDDVVSLFARYWVVPIIVILATNAVILHQFGIELKSDPALFLLYMAIACGRLVFEAFILVCVLWIMGIRVPQGLAGR